MVQDFGFWQRITELEPLFVDLVCPGVGVFTRVGGSGGLAPPPPFSDPSGDFSLQPDRSKAPTVLWDVNRIFSRKPRFASDHCSNPFLPLNEPPIFRPPDCLINSSLSSSYFSHAFCQDFIGGRARSLLPLRQEDYKIAYAG